MFDTFIHQQSTIITIEIISRVSVTSHFECTIWFVDDSGKKRRDYEIRTPKIRKKKINNPIDELDEIQRQNLKAYTISIFPFFSVFDEFTLWTS